jgi:hypothetical protein
MDTKPLFDSLYDKLVLRDLFGKVVPGAMFLLATLVGQYGLAAASTANEKLSVFSWSLVLGLSWLLGFALQYLGELFRLLRTHPHGADGKQTRATFFKDWADFHELAGAHEKIHAERLNIIKEACGNAAVSIAASAAVLLFAATLRGESLQTYISFVVLASVLFVCFWRMHVVHVERYGAFVHGSVNRLKPAAMGAGNDA